MRGAWGKLWVRRLTLLIGGPIVVGICFNAVLLSRGLAGQNIAFATLTVMPLRGVYAVAAALAFVLPLWILSEFDNSQQKPPLALIPGIAALGVFSLSFFEIAEMVMSSLKFDATQFEPVAMFTVAVSYLAAGVISSICAFGLRKLFSKSHTASSASEVF